MPTWGIAAGISAVLAFLLYLAVTEVRKQDKQIATLEMSTAIQKLEAKHKTAIGKAVAEAYKANEDTITGLETDLNTANTQLLRNTINAEHEANDMPVAFGDDFIRDLIRLDCLWSLGERQDDISARTTCSREAQLADTSKSPIPVSVVNPDFREWWYFACEDWNGIGTSKGTINYTVENWEEEYPGFDSKLCHQTVVVFTPAFSYYLRDFLNKREGYTAKVTNFAKTNRTLLDIVTKPKDKVDTSKN